MRKYWIFGCGLLALGVAGVAVPAWGDPSGGAEGEIERAPMPAPDPAAAGGFVVPPAADRALRRAARECGLPAPPTRADFPAGAEIDARRAHFHDRLVKCMPPRVRR